MCFEFVPYCEEKKNLLKLEQLQQRDGCTNVYLRDLQSLET